MNILPVANYNTSNKYNLINTNFKARVTKKAAKNVSEAITAATSDTPTALKEIDKFLRSFGITYCKPADHCINVASGYNGGFYSVQTPITFSVQSAMMYLTRFLSKEHDALGGLVNYIAMVKDIKRQDIVEKGLKLHSFDMNIGVTQGQKETAAKILSSGLKKKISGKNLFFIDNEAFYYDKAEKTGYGINCAGESRTKIKPVIRKCQFETNEKGHAIGYKVSDWNTYLRKVADSEYKEQICPSEKLGPVAEAANNKLYAEAFRFGNTAIHYRVRNGAEKAKEHLKKILGKQTLPTEELQFVKFYDKNKEIQSRICYYDSSIGKSFVYDADGNYKYQLAYNKDSNGNITSCSIL